MRLLLAVLFFHGFSQADTVLVKSIVVGKPSGGKKTCEVPARTKLEATDLEYKNGKILCKLDTSQIKNCEDKELSVPADLVSTTGGSIRVVLSPAAVADCKDDPENKKFFQKIAEVSDKRLSNPIAMDENCSSTEGKDSQKCNCRWGSPFNPQRPHPVKGTTVPHLGVDIPAEAWTPLYAPADGVVLALFDGCNPDKNCDMEAGNHLIINHNPEVTVVACGLTKILNIPNFSTTYLHMARVKVKRGQTVKKGDLIGYLDTTGVVTGPHLHLETRSMGGPGQAHDAYLNPKYFFDMKPSRSNNYFCPKKGTK